MSRKKITSKQKKKKKKSKQTLSHPWPRGKRWRRRKRQHPGNQKKKKIITKNKHFLKLELKKKKKKKKATYWSPSASCTWAFLSFSHQISPHQVFSSFLGEKFLVGPGRKQPGPTIIFPPLPSNQTHSKKLSLLFCCCCCCCCCCCKIHSTKHTFTPGRMENGTRDGAMYWPKAPQGLKKKKDNVYIFKIDWQFGP